MLVGGSCDACTRIARRFGIVVGEPVRYRVWETEFSAPVEAITHARNGIVLILRDNDGTVFPLSIDAVIGLERLAA